MKGAGRPRGSVNPTRERSRSHSPTPAPLRPAAPATKAAGLQPVSKGARNDMEQVFDRLHSMDRSVVLDTISGKGLAQLLSEVGVAPSSLESMVLLWKLGATQRGCISRPEWLTSVYANGMESLTQLRLKLADWVKEVRERSGSFLLMYNYLYDYIRGEEDRRMSLQTATAGWDVFFGKGERYTAWRTWAATNVSGDVSRDLWRQLGIFFTMTGPTTELPSDGVSWPSAIADYVDKDAAAVGPTKRV
ncbi:Cullin binding [Novymonas esmeraldas]|uniref:Defective in cullin neddylation protein n=1 Tax=Novymonas esmeraldas TaxID=1808958 RepID=A0AAW0EVF9_9TRYP